MTCTCTCAKQALILVHVVLHALTFDTCQMCRDNKYHHDPPKFRAMYVYWHV